MKPATVLFESASEVGILNPVVALIRHVTVKAPSPELDGDIAMLLAERPNYWETILSKPEVKAYHDLFGGLGYPNQVPAGERLIGSIRGKGLNRYNNVVDAYNIASARFGSGIGMHDAGSFLKASSDLFITRAGETQTIVPMFKTEQTSIPKGDLTYLFIEADTKILAWLGKRDVDSDQYKVTNNTDTLLLVVLGNSATSQDHNQAICQMVFQLLRKTNPTTTIEFLDLLHV